MRAQFEREREREREREKEKEREKERKRKNGTQIISHRTQTIGMQLSLIHI